MWCDVEDRDCAYVVEVGILGGKAKKCDLCGCYLRMMPVLGKKCPLR